MQVRRDGQENGGLGSGDLFYELQRITFDVNWAAQNLAAVRDVYLLIVHRCCVRLEVT